LIPLFRAVLVWTVILAMVVLPRVQAPASPVTAVITRPSEHSVLENVRTQRAQTAQVAMANAWSREFNQSYDAYQAKLQADAAAAAEVARIAALNNHPPPPAWIGKIIIDAFSPLGQGAVTWALRVAWCESRYHPNSVNSSSGAAGLFQFMPGTWAGSPWHAQSPFDPVANAQAAAWLYHTYGPQRWTCQ
jgi:hypothetical protein